MPERVHALVIEELVIIAKEIQSRGMGYVEREWEIAQSKIDLLMRLLLADMLTKDERMYVHTRLTTIIDVWSGCLSSRIIERLQITANELHPTR